MARVTVEDCVSEVTNRFELVVLAAERAKKISAGAEITVSKNDDKGPVIALREIAAKNLDIEQLRSFVKKRLRGCTGLDETEHHHEDDTIIDSGDSFEYISGNEDFALEDMTDFSSDFGADFDDDVKE